MKILVFANAFHTRTIGGGDKIFVECCKRWIAHGDDVTVITNEEGRSFCVESGISKKNIELWPGSFVDRFGVYVAIPFKTLMALFISLFRRSRADILFASSYFWPDVVPAMVLKWKNTKALFITACYIYTRQKWGKGHPSGRIKGFWYYVAENISLAAIRLFGDAVFTASPLDRREFIKMKRFSNKNVIAIRGGIDYRQFQHVPKQLKRYDAVFVGRFHPQKCLPELLDIWKQVTNNRSGSRLALIGGGPQEDLLRKKVNRLGLVESVDFLGIRDGTEKVKILKASNLFVSASRFDTGNIALDEALGCGIPGVAYNLPHLYYPKGVMKVPVGDQARFVDAIVSLLSDDKKRIRLGKEAQMFAATLDWDAKAMEIHSFMEYLWNRRKSV